MKKKIIKFNENDVENLVKRIIKEDNEDVKVFTADGWKAKTSQDPDQLELPFGGTQSSITINQVMDRIENLSDKIDGTTNEIDSTLTELSEYVQSQEESDNYYLLDDALSYLEYAMRKLDDAMDELDGAGYSLNEYNGDSFYGGSTAYR